MIAVGGTNGRATYGVADDVIPAWSSTGDGTRNPDLVAPGASVVSLRDPGSYVDVEHPTARVGTRFFRGSGTSQAAAVVAGVAALVIQQRTGISPDQVKALLKRTAQELPSADEVAQDDTATPSATQRWPLATGTGSLDAARGTHHVVVDGETLAGEVDFTGSPWDGPRWATAALLEQVWSGGAWTGDSWGGSQWNGRTWMDSLAVDGSLVDGTWSGCSWSGRSWSGRSWSGESWSGRSWSGRSWSTGTWGDPGQ